MTTIEKSINYFAEKMDYDATAVITHAKTQGIDIYQEQEQETADHMAGWLFADFEDNTPWAIVQC